MKHWLVPIVAAASLFIGGAQANFHTYRIEQIYSNADGTVQFVVLHESQGANGESFWAGQRLTSTGPAGTQVYTFPNDLPGGSEDYYGYMTQSPTANTRVLVATEGFAALNIVTPDYVVSNGFLPLTGGRLDFAGVDVVTYASLPTDGVLALQRGGSTIANRATNFAGASGSVAGPAAAPPAPVNYQGLWYNAPAESEAGWGINLAHQGDVIFVTWFTYDDSGKAWWLTMTAQRTTGTTYAGELFETRGPAFNAEPFGPLPVASNPVGSGTLSFTDANNGTFAYRVNGIEQTKAITRQVFGPMPTCVWNGPTSLALASNYQDLWWAAPADSESGWGVNFTHQGNKIFATWFTYDFDGSPLWLSAILDRGPGNVFSGTWDRTAGPPFSATPFLPGNVTHDPTVGSATITFTSGNSATFAYTVALPGRAVVTQSKNIIRQVFRPPGTVCQ